MPRWQEPVARCPTAVSLGLDVRLANDAAVIVILPAQQRAEIRAAHPDRREPLGDELRLDLAVPALPAVNQSASCETVVLAASSRARTATTRVYLVVLESGLSHRRQVRQWLDPRSRTCGERAQRARLACAPPADAYSANTVVTCPPSSALIAGAPPE